MTFFYVDLETTGLDRRKHDAWEIAWAWDDEPVQSMFLQHNGSIRDPGADEVNHYLERCPVEYRTHRRHSMSNPEAVLRLQVRSKKPYVVAASPAAVDLPFLSERWGEEPWHHRTVDISSLAMGVLGHTEPRGLWDIAHELNRLASQRFGLYQAISLPDHSAAADVECLRACHWALRILSAPRARFMMGLPS